MSKCPKNSVHEPHSWGFALSCPGIMPEFSAQDVFPDPLPTITDGDYRAGDHIRFDAVVVTPPGKDGMMELRANVRSFGMGKSLVAFLVNRDKTPGQVLWEEIRKAEVPWDVLGQDTRDRFERAAGKVQELER